MGRPLVLVEGASDARALEVLAERRGLVLGGLAGVDRVADVVAMGGITNLRAHLDRGPREGPVALLHDRGEAAFVVRTLTTLGADVTRFVCEDDLEDELVRALGAAAVLEVLEDAGALASFRRLQDQPAQRVRDVEPQLRRFFSAHSGHKLRFAGLMAGAVPLDRAPAPLVGLLDWVAATR